MAYVYQIAPSMDFDAAVAVLTAEGKHRIVKAAIDNVSVVPDIRAHAADAGMTLQPYRVDRGRYDAYFAKAGYAERYREYYAGNVKEKSFEHFIALELLDLDREDRFVDIASEHSPVPDIYARLTGAKTYRQDIMYPEGVHGDQIGCDACAMPVADASMSRAALTCSLEHFEGDADVRLFHEMHRVLGVGGRIVVVPFYLFTEAATQTDPTMSVPARVEFDAGCTVYCAERWGNRHGRFYSPASFMRRIAEPLRGKMQFDYYDLVNAAEVDPSIYARFALLGTKL